MALTVSVDELVDNSTNPLLQARAGWGRVRLGEIATVLNGYAFKSDLFTRDEGVPLIRIRDVGSSASETRYKGEFDNRYVVNAGDLLVGMDGDFNCARWRGEPSLLNQRVCKITVHSNEYDDRFLDFLLPGYLKAINAATSSTTVKHLSSRSIEEIPLPKPPLHEQIEIVEEFEKQFSRLDEAVANLKRVKANLKRYKAAVLKAAVEGRLVPIEADLARKEGRGYETGGELLCRMLETRRSQRPRKGKYLEPIPAAAPEHRVLPEGWVWTTIGHLLSSPIINGLSIKGSDAPPGVAALKLHAMTDSGFDYKRIRYLPIDVAKVKDILIREGDFYISRGNGSLHLVGRGTIAQSVNGDVIFPDTMMRLRFLPEVTGPNWPQSIWESRLIRQQIEQRLKTTAGIYKIAQPQVESILIPLPPHAEQCRIVAEVARRLSIARQIESQVETNVQRGASCRNAMLGRAFFGDGFSESSG